MEDAEGGDELYANGNIVPLTMAGAAYTKNPEQPEENPEEVETEEIEETTEPEETTPDETNTAEDEDEQGGGE